MNSFETPGIRWGHVHEVITVRWSLILLSFLEAGCLSLTAINSGVEWKCRTVHQRRGHPWHMRGLVTGGWRGLGSLHCKPRNAHLCVQRGLIKFRDTLIEFLLGPRVDRKPGNKLPLLPGLGRLRLKHPCWMVVSQGNQHHSPCVGPGFWPHGNAQTLAVPRTLCLTLRDRPKSLSLSQRFLWTKII